MFKRKLMALDYHTPSDNFSEESAFRNFIVWLEDQKVRHYKIEDRTALRHVTNPDWEQAFQKYLNDLGCTFPLDDRNALIDWLLGFAVRLEYGDNVEKYKSAGSKKAGLSNPLDKLDFNDADFKAGVASLAQLLQIPPHPDHLVVLKAVCLLVKEKLSKEALERLSKEGMKPATSITLDKIELGFETADYITQEAAKILRLLHIRELRELQNLANEAIVAVQSITANPKTDTKLGKVGSM